MVCQDPKDQMVKMVLRGILVILVLLVDKDYQDILDRQDFQRLQGQRRETEVSISRDTPNLK